MKVFDQKVSFAGGELSPQLFARVDLAQYGTAARKLENFLVLPQGGLINRPGSMAMGQSYPVIENKPQRLIPFVFSETDSTILLFGDTYIDMYNRNGYIDRMRTKSDDGNDQPLVTPYELTNSKYDLNELRFLQSASYLYLFHPNYPPMVLKRVSTVEWGGRWELSVIEFKDGPFRDFNTDDKIKMMLQYDEDEAQWILFITGPGTGSYFVPEMVGSLVKLEKNIDTFSEEYEFKNSTQYLPPGDPGTEYCMGPVFGSFTWRTTGKWVGQIDVYIAKPGTESTNWNNQPNKDPYAWPDEGEPGSPWKSFKTYTSDKDAEENFAFSGVVTEYANYYKFILTEISTSKKPKLDVDWEGGVIERIVKIVESPSANMPQEAIVVPTDSIAVNIEWTDAWAMGAFSEWAGWPAVGIFHQERLCLARTKMDKQSIWMSKSASWHNFGNSIPTVDDDTISLTLASKQVNEIRGLASRGDLLIFTSGGEWVAKAGAKTDTFTPSSIVITPSGYRGCKDLDILDVGGVTLFVQRHGRIVRTMGYSLNVDGYESTELSVMSSHIIENNPIMQWTYQQTPWSIVWMVLTDGSLCAVTIQQEHQVNAWTRQKVETQSQNHTETRLFARVRDVCAIPGNGQDDLFMLVERTNGDGDDMAVVEMQQHRKDTQGYIRQGTFADAGLYPINSFLESLELELPANTTMQGRHKFVPAITLRLMETKSVRAGVMNEINDRLDQLQFPLPIPGHPGPSDEWYFSGDVRLVTPGGSARGARVRIESDPSALNYPISILGLFPEVTGPDS
jgi:hypothetical protein